MTFAESLTMPVSTTHEIPGREITGFIGPVFGVIVLSSGTGRNITGSFKALKRGEVREFTASVEAARQTAVERLVAHATEIGGNAVVGLRFDSTDMGQTQGMAEIVAYGTAVTLT